MINVLTAGEFGHAVYRHLRELRADIFETPLGETGLPSQIKGRICILAAWRPMPQVCRKLNALSYSAGSPFVPLIMENTVLRVGPVVVPPRSGCWECWQRRSHQHSPWVGAQRALENYYDTHPTAGPQGFLEPLGALSAARLAEVIEEVDLNTASPGHVWQMDLVSQEIVTSKIVGVHGCVQCGLKRSAATRNAEAMRRDLSWLWPNSAQNGDGQ